MKNISYLLSLLLAFSFVSFADEEVKETPKESEEVGEEVTEESSGEEAEEDKEPTISEFIEEGDFEVIEGMLDIYYETEEDTYYTIIEEGNLSKEFIYFYYIISGAQAGGASGGAVSYTHLTLPTNDSSMFVKVDFEILLESS